MHIVITYHVGRPFEFWVLRLMAKIQFRERLICLGEVDFVDVILQLFILYPPSWVLDHDLHQLA